MQRLARWTDNALGSTGMRLRKQQLGLLATLRHFVAIAKRTGFAGSASREQKPAGAKPIKDLRDF